MVDSRAPSLAWEEKLRRYHALGASEIVRFDPDGAGGDRQALARAATEKELAEARRELEQLKRELAERKG